MLKNNLILSVKEYSISLSLPAVNRILFLFIGTMLTIGIVFSEKAADRMWIPVLLALVSAGGAAYTEKWTFDKISTTVTYIRGIAFIPFLRTQKIFTFEEISRFRLSEISYTKGKSYCTFSVKLISGKSLEIERGSGKHTCETIKDNAAYISVYCDKKLDK